jgi:hypothetical protein
MNTPHDIASAILSGTLNGSFWHHVRQYAWRYIMQGDEAAYNKAVILLESIGYATVSAHLIILEMEQMINTFGRGVDERML